MTYGKKLPQPKTRKDFRKLIQKYLKGPLFWVGSKSLDGMGLSYFTRLEGIFACFYGQEVKLFRNPKFVNTLEQETGQRKHWSRFDVSSVFDEDKFINQLDKYTTQGVNLLCYCGSKKINQVARQKRWRVFSPPEEVTNYLENKYYITNILENLGVPYIQNEVIDITQTKYSDIIRKYGPRLVLQTAMSSAGEGTMFVDNADEYNTVTKNLKKKNHTLKVSKFIDGHSLSVHACTTQNGTIVGPAMHQMIGIKKVSNNPAAFCGSHWSCKESDSILSQKIISKTMAIGDHLYDAFGFKGIFGIDFLWEKDTNKVYVLEINPRFQGSLQLFTSTLNKKSLIPLPVFHMLEYLQVDYDFDVLKYNKILSEKSGSAFQLYLYNTKNKEIKIRQNIKPGIYSINNTNGLKFVRNGYMVEHLKKSEYLVTGGVPSKNFTISPNSIIFNIQGSGKIYDTTCGKLTSHGKSIVKEVKKMIC